MRTWNQWMILLGCLGAMGCSDPPPPPKGDAGTIELPLCTGSSEMYAYDASHANPGIIASGGRVPIVLGFQQLRMAQLGVRSSHRASGVARAQSHIFVPGASGSQPILDLWSEHPNLASVDRGSGLFDTEEIILMVNDVPIVDLDQRPATVQLIVALDSCKVDVTRDVVLIDGGSDMRDSGVHD